MRTAYGFVLAAALIGGPVSSAFAHHSFIAEFDPAKPMVLQGTITKLEWTNPHSRFYVDVKGENGVASNWEVELGSPNTLLRYGWKRDTLNVGDVVTVDGFLARDGHQLINAKTVKLSDGRTVTAGSSYKTGTSPAQ